MRVSLISLGCPKNLVDSEVMLGHLVQAGHVIKDEPAQADAIIVNTCAFIEPAREEAIETLLDAAECKRSGRCKVLICTGCLPQRYADDLQAAMPEVDAFVGVGEINRITQVLEAAAAGQGPVAVTDSTFLYSHETPRRRLTPPWLAYVKIAEGCRHSCTFCAIPAIRGPLKSRPLESICVECEKLADEGVREINLIAQDCTSYGRDRADRSLLPELLAELGRIEGDFWVRVLYLHPAGVDDRLLEVIARERNIVPYIDIPLQHASPRLLKAMGRPGSADAYLKLLRRIRDQVPEVAIRSTFLLGFPSETEDDFQALLEFLEEAQLDRVTGFVFSPEDGTPAFQMGGRVPPSIAEDRLFRMMDLQQDISLANQRRLLGRKLRVLLEERRADGVVVGRSTRDAPQVDGSVFVEGDAHPGTFAWVQVTDVDAHDLYAAVVDGGAPPSGSCPRDTVAVSTRGADRWR